MQLLRPAAAFLAALTLFGLAAPAVAGPAPPITSRFVRLNENAQCREIPLGDEEVGDEVGKRCPGLGPVRIWIWYFDGVRMRIGFGRVGNLTGMFSAERNEAWPFEFRGRMVRGQFTPFAVIARLVPAGDPNPATDLVVWRLTPEGTSCIVGRIPPGPNQNVRAHQAADRAVSAADTPCEAEPEPIAE